MTETEQCVSHQFFLVVSFATQIHDKHEVFRKFHLATEIAWNTYVSILQVPTLALTSDSTDKSVSLSPVKQSNKNTKKQTEKQCDTKNITSL